MITFNLKKEWFDKIKSGEKTHEYRLATDYWRKRIEKWVFTAKMRRLCPYIELRCGYPKSTDKDKILKAVVIEQPKIVSGKNTDLAIDKDVYDIEFKLIQENEV